MWSDYLDGNKFLKTMYDTVPELINVRISKIQISDEGDKVTVAFDLPYFADRPPKRWLELGHNTAVVEIDFFDIQELSIKSFKGRYKGDIDITKNESGEIIISIIGSVEAIIKANVGNISSVKGYCNAN